MGILNATPIFSSRYKLPSSKMSDEICSTQDPLSATDLSSSEFKKSNFICRSNPDSLNASSIFGANSKRLVGNSPILLICPYASFSTKGHALANVNKLWLYDLISSNTIFLILRIVCAILSSTSSRRQIALSMIVLAQMMSSIFLSLTCNIFN